MLIDFIDRCTGFRFSCEWVGRWWSVGLYDSRPTELWKGSAPMKYLLDRNLVEERLLCFGHLFFFFFLLMWRVGMWPLCALVCVCVDNHQLVILCSFSLGALLVFINRFCIPQFYSVNLILLLCVCVGVCAQTSSASNLKTARAHTHTHWCSHMLTE